MIFANNVLTTAKKRSRSSSQLCDVLNISPCNVNQLLYHSTSTSSHQQPRQTAAVTYAPAKAGEILVNPVVYQYVFEEAPAPFLGETGLRSFGRLAVWIAKQPRIIRYDHHVGTANTNNIQQKHQQLLVQGVSLIQQQHQICISTRFYNIKETTPTPQLQICFVDPTRVYGCLYKQIGSERNVTSYTTVSPNSVMVSAIWHCNQMLQHRSKSKILEPDVADWMV